MESVCLSASASETLYLLSNNRRAHRLKKLLRMRILIVEFARVIHMSAMGAAEFVSALALGRDKGHGHLAIGKTTLGLHSVEQDDA